MADIHILDSDANWTRLRAVFHFAVPVELNKAGMTLTAAMVAAKMGKPTCMTIADGKTGTIDAAEAAKIEACEVGEIAYMIPLGKTSMGQPDVAPTATKESIAADLRYFYGIEKTRFLERARTAVRWYGHTESEKAS